MAEEELNEEPAPPSALELRPWPRALDKMGETPKMDGAFFSPENEQIPLKRDYFSREYIFQPLIFRGNSLVFQGVQWKKPY